ncbi:Gfo/Idh/MocA family oxidoreductase [Paenibacillus sp. MMS20-IR301]|uniref:Gfo/Idh/MocA family protein n=1 Tax=Paenibacillus sp. MMS20-IR301 TaxID=2895946 RepID=UPI0028F0F3A0|nr:Gfo/Idh/MocA family oxidoreductase [Paenibacillus sp. MMS20-IR301]WNS46878.1 Gfo/Idh/MocA family oxidoreductase [Paenibacillus sp. MMS20-IR301]
MNTLGAAIIGCGAISPLHAGAIASMENVQLLAVADSDPVQAVQTAQTYGCEGLTDYRELLERRDISMVHLCTPHHLHARMAVDLLKAGKHVLTEKPLAHDVPSARMILDAAEHSAGQLGVVFQNRYNDPSMRIKEIISAGSLGKLLCMKGIVTWTRSEEYYRNSSWRGRWATEGGGVLMNQTIHTLDLLQWFGGEISAVQGSVTTDVLDQVIEVEDSAHACFTFKNGVRGLFYGTNAYAVNSPVELELVFQEGTLLQRRDCLYLWKDGQETLLSEPPAVSTGGKSYWGTGHSRLIHDFYAHIRDGRKFWIDGVEAIKALELIAGIYRSSESRREVASGQHL